MRFYLKNRVIFTAAVMIVIAVNIAQHLFDMFSSSVRGQSCLRLLLPSHGKTELCSSLASRCTQCRRLHFVILCCCTGLLKVHQPQQQNNSATGRINIYADITPIPITCALAIHSKAGIVLAASDRVSVCPREN